MAQTGSLLNSCLIIIHLPLPIERLDAENRIHSPYFLARTRVYVPDTHDKTTVFIYLASARKQVDVSLRTEPHSSTTKYQLA